MRRIISENLNSFSALCDPCANPFDFVAKFETLTEDANWLLERANSKLKFPAVKEGNFNVMI